MILLAAALTAAIQLDLDLTSVVRTAAATESAVTCNIETVGYRFRGAPGQKFRYAGETFEVPRSGSIELLADQNRTSYTIADRSLPLDVWPRDPFGFREISLPTAAALAEGVSR